jgi:hypothetical protein
MRKLLIIICICGLAGHSNAQEQQLTKQQMYADFDEFVKIQEDVNIEIDIRKKATGYDALQEIKQFRPEIEQINSYWEFISFMEKCLVPTLGVHAALVDFTNPTTCIPELIDTQYIMPIANGYRTWLSEKNKKKEKSLGRSFYNNGNYYIYGTYRFIDAAHKDTITLSDFRILALDDVSIDSIDVKRYATVPFLIRWDYRLNRYYHSWLPVSPMKISAEDSYTKRQYTIDRSQYGGLIMNGISLSKEEEKRLSAKEEKSDNQKITYYDALKLLYIYTDRMDSDNKDFVDSIKHIAFGRKINKIIFDVRGNRGGADKAWRNILSGITGDTLYENNIIGFKDCELSRKYMKAYMPSHQIEEKDIVRNQRIELLDNLPAFYLAGIDTIAPDSNSLHYKEKIYILQDEDTYSAAQYLVSFARQSEQLVSVGVPTGHVAGAGMTPWAFQLTNSKFTFRVDITADLSNVKTTMDLFQDRPEIEIYPTAEEKIRMRNYGSYLNKRGDEFLFKYDYLFKKVLELQ